MRFTLAIVLATALAIAGLAVFIHERAAAQQAVAAQTQAAAAGERGPAAERPAAAQVPGEDVPSRLAAEPSAIPTATLRPAEAVPQTGDVNQTAPSVNFGYPPPATSSAPSPYYSGVALQENDVYAATATSSAPSPYYSGWQKDFVRPTADPETQELTAQDQQLESEVQTLARQLADSEEEKERADLKQKLASALEKQFEAQQKLRELEISRIETRVQKLRDLVRKRTDSRRKIIDNRYEQLLNDAEGLGWNPASTSGAKHLPQGQRNPAAMAPYGRPMGPPGGNMGGPGSLYLPLKK